MKKRWRSFILIVLVVACVLIAGFAVLSWSRQNAQRERDLGYQSALQKYRDDLGSATTRDDVERNLQSKNVKFRQLCCVDNENSAYSDLVLIGKEDPPWYCSENNVYIAFQFGASEGPESRPPSSAGVDVLKAITVYQKLDDCL